MFLCSAPVTVSSEINASELSIVDNLWRRRLQVNQSKDSWILQATVTGKCFSGPAVLNALAGQITDYPLKFLPLFDGAYEVQSCTNFFSWVSFSVFLLFIRNTLIILLFCIFYIFCRVLSLGCSAWVVGTSVWKDSSLK